MSKEANAIRVPAVTVRAIIIGMVVIVAILGFAGYKVYFKPHRSVENESFIGVKASELFSAFETNEAEANHKYLDKVVLVDGVVSEVLSNQDGKPVMLLKTENPLFGISCTMTGNMESIEAGTPVKVKGICTGYLSDVVITDGLLIED